jgi:hypothetical protein
VPFKDAQHHFGEPIKRKQASLKTKVHRGHAQGLPHHRGENYRIGQGEGPRLLSPVASDHPQGTQAIQDRECTGSLPHEF